MRASIIVEIVGCSLYDVDVFLDDRLDVPAGMTAPVWPKAKTSVQEGCEPLNGEPIDLGTLIHNADNLLVLASPFVTAAKMLQDLCRYL